MAATLTRYPYSLDEPLLWLTPTNPWTIRDACEGTQILGDMGSGKTTGSGRVLALAFLRAGFGGLVLCKKTDECARWLGYLQETGRLAQALVVHPSTGWCCNVLEYQMRRGGDGGGYVENAVNLFMNLVENRREGSGQRSRNQEAFWVDGVRRLLRHALETLLLAGEPVTMDGLRQIMTSLPYAHPQTGVRVWDDQGLLRRALIKAEYRHRHGLISGPHLTPKDLVTYFEQEFGRPGSDRQSAGLVSTFTGMAEPFMSGPVRDVFCTTTNFVPEFSRKGAVILLNLPTDEWEEIGRTAQLTLKYLWQRAMLRRQGLQEPGDVPVFLWADEAQTFTTSMDKAFQEAARSSVACTVYLTQNINNYMAAFHDNAEALTNALLAGLNTKIFHRNGDSKTNQWAAETIAKQRVAFYSGNTGTSESTSYSRNSSMTWNKWEISRTNGKGYGDGTQNSWNNGWTEHMEYQILPEMFTRLRSGSPSNHNEVEAIVFKSGAKFAPHGKPFAGVIFDQ
jgi:hypothetical protein